MRIAWTSLKNYFDILEYLKSIGFTFYSEPRRIQQQGFFLLDGNTKLSTSPIEYLEKLRYKGMKCSEYTLDDLKKIHSNLQSKIKRSKKEATIVLSDHIHDDDFLLKLLEKRSYKIYI